MGVDWNNQPGRLTKMPFRYLYRGAGAEERRRDCGLAGTPVSCLRYPRSSSLVTLKTLRNIESLEVRSDSQSKTLIKSESSRWRIGWRPETLILTLRP